MPFGRFITLIIALVPSLSTGFATQRHPSVAVPTAFVGHLYETKTSVTTRPATLFATKKEEDEELYEAEEAAAFDAHDLSDPGMEAAAMERAVVMAENIAHKKKKEAEAKRDAAEMAEDEFRVVEKAVEDLERTIKQYASARKDEDLKRLADESEAGELALLMLEKATAAAAAQALKSQEREMAAKEAIKAAAEELHKASAAAARAHGDAKAAEDRAFAIETYDDVYEDEERKRDLSVSHAAHHLEEDTEIMMRNALLEEKRAKDEAAEAHEMYEKMKRSTAGLKADLKELHNVVNEKHMEEWKKEKEQKQM